MLLISIRLEEQQSVSSYPLLGYLWMGKGGWLGPAVWWGRENPFYVPCEIITPCCLEKSTDPLVKPTASILNFSAFCTEDGSSIFLQALVYFYEMT